MPGGPGKIFVGRQQHQAVPNAQLREQRVDRADLHPGAAASITQFSGVDVILPIGNEERERSESRDDVAARPGTGKSLQQFLKHQARAYNDLSSFESPAQSLHLGSGCIPVAPQGERPDARIDEQRHRRERSAL